MGYTWPPWSTADPDDLARRLIEDAGRYLGLTSPPLPPAATPDERIQRVHAVAGAIVRQRLVPDPVSLLAPAVQVRTPVEVLDGHASSLDVALLLAGASLAAGLLPILVISAAGSALVLIDVDHGLSTWDSPQRWDPSLFPGGLSRDTAAVRDLVRTRNYLAVDPMPLLRGGPGATEDPFVAAVRAGGTLLDTAPIRFALDLATLVRGRGIEPLPADPAPPAAPPVSVAPVATIPIVRSVVPTAGHPPARPLPRPVQPALSPPARCYGRERELGAIREGLARGKSTRVVGPAGSGRTTVLRTAAHDPGLLARRPDGVVQLDGRGRGPDDLLLDLYLAFYTDDTPPRPGHDVILGALRDLSLTAVIDDCELAGPDLATLMSSLPQAVFLVAATTAGGADLTVPLPGLAETEAVALIESQARRALTRGERTAATVIAVDLDGHPGSLALVGGQIRLGVPVDAVRNSIQADPSRSRSLAVTMFHALPVASRTLLSALVATRVATASEHLAAVASLGQVEPALRDLADRGLVNGGPGYWSAPAYVAEALTPYVDPVPWLGRFLGHLLVWAELHADDCDRILADQELLVRVAVAASETGWREEAARLAGIIESCLVLNGQWGPTLRLAAVLTAAAASVAAPVAASMLSASAAAPASVGHGAAGVSTGGGAAGLSAQAILIPAVAGLLAVPLLIAPSQASNAIDRLPARAGPVEVAPGTLNFGAVDIGLSTTRSLQVNNTSSSALAVSDSVTTATGDFAVVADACRVNRLSPAGQCTVTITFTPHGTGHRNGSVHFAGAWGSLDIKVTGTGRATLTSGDLAGFYAFGDIRYTCLSRTGSQTCQDAQTAIDEGALPNLRQSFLNEPAMPVHQVQRCAGTACAYRVTNDFWGDFTILPDLGDTESYTVRDSNLQGQLNQQVQAFNDALRQQLPPGDRLELSDVSELASVHVATHDHTGRADQIQLTVESAYTITIASGGQQQVLTAVDRFTVELSRIG
jgi:hypothetical protein